MRNSYTDRYILCSPEKGNSLKATLLPEYKKRIAFNLPEFAIPLTYLNLILGKWGSPVSAAYSIHLGLLLYNAI